MVRILLILQFLTGPLLRAQEKPSAWVPPLQSTASFTVRKAFLDQCHGLFLQALLETGTVSLVDRSLLDLVETERELQKTEDFLDGKFVAQGMAIGAAYIMQGTYNPAQGLFSVDILRTGNGQLVARETCHLDHRWDVLQWSKALQQVADAVAGRIHPLDRIPVLRILEEKKGKAENVLIAAGSRHGLTKGTVLQVYRLESYPMGNQTLHREVPIAEVRTLYVENADFSQGKVLFGEKSVADAMRAGTALFARRPPTPAP
ncbi:MAG: hypothetical protein RLY31_2798 [Bacteroidota bacterium]|jgi:hypothetical protein